MDYAASRKHLTNDNSNESFALYGQTAAQTGGAFSRRKAPKEEDSSVNTFVKTTPSSNLANGLSKEIPAPLTIEPPSPALTTGSNSGDEHLTTSGRIARPKNAFMLYRSEFLAGDKINRSVEHDNRHISRIIGHCWRKLSKEDKLFWHQRAEIEKIEHSKKHPNYRFSPVPRAKKPLKRKGKRNGEKEMERCRQVADLLLAGKEGDELAAAIKRIDLENAGDNSQDSPETPGASYAYYPPEESRTPVFVNPLSPPSAHNASLPPANDSPSAYSMYTNNQGHRQQYYPSPPESPASPNFMFSDNRIQNPYYLRPATFYPQQSSLTSDTRTHVGSYSPGTTHGHVAYERSTNSHFLQTQNEQINRGLRQDTDFFMDDAEQTYTFLSPSLPPTLAPSRYNTGNNFYGDSG